jgi:hypothetical protein
MFERYTERARRVLVFARYEASQLGSISIETEHLLLGLIREGKGLTSRIFARSHLSLENIRKDIEGRTVFHDRISTSVEIPFTPECKRALGYAAEEADRLQHNYIGTEHLLLGVLREERSVAASVLMDRGMRLQTVRDDIVQLLGTAQPRNMEINAVERVERETVYSPQALGAQMLPQYRPSHVEHITYSFSPPHQEPWIQHAGSAWRAYGYTLAQIIAMAWKSHEGLDRTGVRRTGDAGGQSSSHADRQATLRHGSYFFNGCEFTSRTGRLRSGAP